MRKLFLPIIFCTVSVIAKGQITIQPVIPLGGMIQKAVLWNVALINTAPGPFECRLQLTLRERATGVEVMNATTGLFTLPSGAKQVNASQLFPIQYNLLSPAFSSRPDDFIPIGNYTVCYSVTAGKFGAAEECASFDVEPLNPPMLINPSDSSVTEVAPAQFSWIPPAPFNLFNRLQYEVNIVEVNEGQKAEEAIQQNLPFYTESNIQINNLPYTNAASSFEKDKWYAWQVTARDDMNYAGKSEVWVFKWKNDKPQISVEEYPFTRLRTDNPEFALAPQGTLKFVYNNRTGDTLISLVIKRPASRESASDVEVKIPVKQGENFIAYDLRKMFKPNENVVYSASLTNSRREHYRINFTVKYLDK